MKHRTAPRKQVAGSSSRKQATGPELRRLLKAIRQAGGEVEQCKRRNHWKVHYNDQVIGVLRDRMGADPMTRRRQCVCCGFTSDNRHLFQRAKTEWQGRLLGYGDDDWICRSFRACAERSAQ